MGLLSTIARTSHFNIITWSGPLHYHIDHIDPDFDFFWLIVATLVDDKDSALVRLLAAYTIQKVK